MKLSIILLSSDNYEELALENLEMLLNKFGDKVSYDVVLASSADNLNKLNTKHKFVFDKVFSKRLIKAISKIETEYVMLWLDDYRIKNINFVLFEKCFHLFKNFNAGACKLFPIETPRIHVPGMKDFGIYDQYPLGKLNTQPTIYEKKFLEKLIVPNENLWEFENNHSVRSISEKKIIFGALSKIIDYEEIVKKGKFIRKYKKLYPNIINIKKLSIKENISITLKGKIFRVLLRFFRYNNLIKIKKFFT